MLNDGAGMDGDRIDDAEWMVLKWMMLEWMVLEWMMQE